MQENGKRGIFVLTGSLILGVLGDLLLRATPWGLNFTIWMIAACALFVWYAHRWTVVLLRGSTWLVLGAILLSSLLALGEAPLPCALAVVGALVAMMVVAGTTKEISVYGITIAECAHGLLVATVHVFVGPIFLLLKDVPLNRAGNGRTTTRFFAGARGVLVAFPALLFFGNLLTRADAGFDSLVRGALDVDLLDVFSHFFLVALIGWLAAGLLRGRLMAEPVPVPCTQGAAGIPFAGTEIAITLGALNLLFGAFVYTQVPYLFGGLSHIASTPGLTAADYARRGFFELVGVAAAAIPILLVTDWLQERKTPAGLPLYRFLAGFQVLLLLLMLASALQRMLLYDELFGLTELRIYVFAFLMWIMVTLVWFACTVLRGKRRLFVFGPVICAFAGIMALSLLNPEKLVVQSQVGRAAAGLHYDAHYLAQLSGDAVPQMVQSFTLLREGERAIVARHLLSRFPPEARDDWRTWNWSRAQARAAVRANAAMLRAAALSQLQ